MKYLIVSSQQKQSGVVLILALVILLILTLLMVSSMNTTNMQVLMTGNTQYHIQALNDAEFSLRFAESSIDQFSSNVKNKPVTGYYNLKSDPNSAIDFSKFNWDFARVAQHKIGLRDSVYVIEYIGPSRLIGSSIVTNQDQYIPGDTIFVYRITARGSSARGAVRLVQSIYTTINAPK